MKITIKQDNGTQTVIEITSSEPSGAIPSSKYNAILSWLFRQLNRVDGTELITLFNLPIPSLSVGDIVQIDQREWRCEHVGWREL